MPENRQLAAETDDGTDAPFAFSQMAGRAVFAVTLSIPAILLALVSRLRHGPWRLYTSISATTLVSGGNPSVVVASFGWLIVSCVAGWPGSSRSAPWRRGSAISSSTGSKGRSPCQWKSGRGKSSRRVAAHGNHENGRRLVNRPSRILLIFKADVPALGKSSCRVHPRYGC